MLLLLMILWVNWAQLGSFPAQHDVFWDCGQLGWAVQDGVPHGEQLVLAAIGSKLLCQPVHLGSPPCGWSFSQHGRQGPRGRKQKLPVLLRPGFRSSRISFLWLQQ